MEELLLKLVFELLKLVLQLVLFVVTGKWHKLGKLSDLVKNAQAQAQQKLAQQRADLQKQAQDKRGQRPKQKRRPPAERVGKPRPNASAGDGPWPFEFAPELSAPEPAAEARELEGARGPIFQGTAGPRRRPRDKLRVPALPAPRSIASAMRDRKTVRAAIVLGAALAPRRPRV